MKTSYRGWRVVGAAFTGLAVSPGPIAFYSLGVLMGPLEAQHGWSTAQVSLVATILTVSIIAIMPLIGAAIDRFGAKQVLLPSMVAFALTLACAGFAPNLGMFYVTYAAIGLVCAGANSVPYMRAISMWFDRRRGLAIGIASAGMGTGFALVPAYTQFLVDRGGAAAAYIGLGALILFVGVPIVALFFRNGPRAVDLEAAEFGTHRGAGPDSLEGASASQALRMYQLWILLIVYACAAGSVYGTAIHLVPAVQHIDPSGGKAVLAATLFGITAMVGRVVAGFLCDRFFAPYVAAGVFLGGAAGIAILAVGAPGIWPLVAALLIGFCSGAEGDTVAVLCSRYFGRRAYGKIYGHAFSATLVGISIVPYMVGVGFERLNGYRGPLLIVAVVLGVGAMLILRLGPYPSYDAMGNLVTRGREEHGATQHRGPA